MTGERPFRCRACNWRGWIGVNDTDRSRRRKTTKISPGAAFGIAAAIVLVLGVPWFVRGRAPAATSLATVAPSTPERPAATLLPPVPSQPPPLALLWSEARLNDTDDFWYIDGEITNLTGQALNNVQVLSTWYDNQGKAVAAHTDMVDLKQLLPGETSAFRTITSVQPSMTTYRLEFRSAVGRPLATRDDSQGP
jgi:hypothetical protein